MPQDAIIREVFEETGIVIDTDILSFEQKLYVDNPYFGKYILHLFSHPCKSNVKIQLSLEHTDFQWITLEQARKIPLLHGGYKSLNLFDSKE